jgi:hypothetical protein
MPRSVYPYIIPTNGGHFDPSNPGAAVVRKEPSIRPISLMRFLFHFAFCILHFAFFFFFNDRSA